MSTRMDAACALRRREVIEVIRRPDERCEVSEGGFPADTEQMGTDLRLMDGSCAMRPRRRS